MKTLRNCDNAFGTLSPSIVQRIKVYIKQPTVDAWDDISSIIVRLDTFGTIWQAMCAFDDTFPRVGRSTDADGEVVADWARIPTEFELLLAIKRYTSR